jgi:uncharacterized protein YgbK (DUF1537 family)
MAKQLYVYLIYHRSDSLIQGEITSSDAATKSLNIKRAMMVGQAAPSVPVGHCSEATSRHTGILYVVFPGDFGSTDVGRFGRALGDLEFSEVSNMKSTE